MFLFAELSEVDKKTINVSDLFVINYIHLPISMLRRTGCIITSFFLLSLIPSDNVPTADTITQELTAYSWSHPQEKIYIHTDKPYYVTNEDIWFKAYLMVGPYQVPDTLSSALYAELIDSSKNIIDRKVIHMQEGLGYGDFNLSPDFHPGKYILKAYTRYMQNYDPAFYFRKWIDILPAGLKKDSKINKTTDTDKVRQSIEEQYGRIPLHMQFFPEGGYMIENLQNIIAFKISGPDGKGVDAEGTVRDSAGEDIVTFKSKKFGLGKFLFTPKQGEKYHASFVFGNHTYTFPLPQGKKNGYVMHLNTIGNNIYILVRNNMVISMKNTFVIGQFRGFPFITIHAKPDLDYINTPINLKELPSGIIQFTFFDAGGIPQCERLIYNENEKEKINFTIHSNKKTYKKRENTDFYIDCADLDGKPTLTNLSVSITNTSIIKPDPDRSNIMSYFNLESDLKGTIENPGYYFNPDNKDRLELLDILMLTHGWRRFVWKEILNGQSQKLQYPPESGFDIEGNLVDFYNQAKPQSGFVRLFIFENKFYYTELQTNGNGWFDFRGLDIFDSTQVVLQAWRERPKGKKINLGKSSKIKNDLAIKIDPVTYTPVIPDSWPDYLNPDIDFSGLLQQNHFIQKIDSAYDQRTIVLNELLVQDSKITGNGPYEKPGKLYREPSDRILLDSLSDGDQSLPLFDLIRKYIPGVNYHGVPPDLQITMRGPTSMGGDNQPLMLLDGVPVEINYMYFFPATEVDFIDVLKSGKAAIYGARGSNGVIAVYTRSGSGTQSQEGRMGVTNFIYPGYYMAREFYTPDYDIKDEKHIKPDYRRTLYWNPSLTTDKQGMITFSFFTSDETGEYRVNIEGMTYSGIPVVREYYFNVK